MRQRGFADILLIIIGLFTTIVLFGYFRDDKKLVTVQLPADDYTAIPEKISMPYTGCGIRVNSPETLSEIGNVFEFSGKVSGCGWNPQNGFIGDVEIQDSNEKPLTDKIKVPVKSDGTFKITIALKRQSPTTEGRIYLQSLDKLQIASINVYFK